MTPPRLTKLRRTPTLHLLYEVVIPIDVLDQAEVLKFLKMVGGDARAAKAEGSLDLTDTDGLLPTL